MPTETVHVDWIEDRVFLLRDHHGFPIVMSQPQGVSGADLLPLSLIGCLAWDVLAIAQKQHLQITRLEVSAASERDPEPPWRFRKIRIGYLFTGRNLKKEAIERAIQLSEAKYCSIYATLREAVELLSEYELMDETSALG